MSDCLPCQKSADPEFLEKLKATRRINVSPPNMLDRSIRQTAFDVGAGLSRNPDTGITNIDVAQIENNYQVISKEGNQLFIQTIRSTTPIEIYNGTDEVTETFQETIPIDSGIESNYMSIIQNEGTMEDPPVLDDELS